MSDLRGKIADLVWRARAYPGDKTPEQVADKILSAVRSTQCNCRLTMEEDVGCPIHGWLRDTA